jgi:hypothetical protein
MMVRELEAVAVRIAGQNKLIDQRIYGAWVGYSP